MHVLILGPTGTAGSALLTQALADYKISRVTTLHRRKTGIQHHKLQEVLHSNFTNYTGLESLFATIDVCFLCLGISQLKEKDRDRFFQITHDYPVALAKALFKANPSVVFCFLSGQGADPTGKSKVAFAKAKGAAENSLNDLGLKQLYIFRPGYIHPDRPRSDRPIGEKVSGFLYPVIRYIFPRFIITAEQLAKGMIHVGLHGYPEKLLDNQMIKAVTNEPVIIDQS
jgi:uncharacterized protein YbjT (DUF2867 family)